MEVSRDMVIFRKRIQLRKEKRQNSRTSFKKTVIKLRETTESVPDDWVFEVKGIQENYRFFKELRRMKALSLLEMGGKEEQGGSYFG